jgi:D-alanyl-D-alanine carboxypeptidase/D-alanyl-D-alanine-endopeptidase (penicillin-binding protein 4)
MLKIILFLIVSFYSGILLSQDKIQEILNNEHLKTASVALSVYDLTSKKTVYSYNENKSLRPASNLKLLSTAAILETLGANYRFKTLLKNSGTISESRLNGNLYVIGGGDPSLGSYRFNKENPTKFIDEWIKTLQEKNIKTITGDLIIVDTLFKKQQIPPTWVWGDVGNYYGAGVKSISIFDNQYKIYFDTKVAINDTVKILKIVPEIDGMILTNNVTAKKIRGDKTNIYGVPKCNLRTIDGFLPVNKDSFIVKGSIPNPALILAKVFKEKLKNNAINLQGKITIIETPFELKNLSLLHTTYSPTLIEIIEKTNKKSINLYAETLMRQLSIANGLDGSNKSATKSLTKYWQQKAIDISAMKLYDGSGLSTYNLITAKQFVDILKIIYTDSLNYPNYISTLPVSGVSGTLKYFLNRSEAKTHVFAKSGSMSGIKAYSGYIETKKKNILVFSFMINNYTCSKSAVKKDMERVLTYLYLNY